MTDVYVISGFLGAGKTTLIKTMVHSAFKNKKESGESTRILYFSLIILRQVDNFHYICSVIKVRKAIMSEEQITPNNGSYSAEV